MRIKTRMGYHIIKWFIFFIGQFIMSLGIVLTIKADLGAAPWDVLHIGLFKQFGLTIGSWSVLAGFAVLLLSSIVAKQIPQLGAFVNMLTVGIFIDSIMLLPILPEPETVLYKASVLIIGTFIWGYGMGLYISAKCGAGPRDSLMLALSASTGWDVQTIRYLIEALILFIGWLLGGPVFIGTFIYLLLIGKITGIALIQCQHFTSNLLLYNPVNQNEFSVKNFSN